MVAVNVYATSQKVRGLTGKTLLNWINKTLDSNIVSIEELCTGAAYCQLMDILFRGSICMRRVTFRTNMEYDYVQNFKLLQLALKKLKVKYDIPIDKLTKGSFVANFKFLQWFKLFFDANYVQHTYDAKAERRDLPLGIGSVAKMERFGQRQKQLPPQMSTALGSSGNTVSVSTSATYVIETRSYALRTVSFNHPSDSEGSDRGEIDGGEGSGSVENVERDDSEGSEGGDGGGDFVNSGIRAEAFYRVEGDERGDRDDGGGDGGDIGDSGSDHDVVASFDYPTDAFNSYEANNIEDVQTTYVINAGNCGLNAAVDESSDCMAGSFSYIVDESGNSIVNENRSDVVDNIQKIVDENCNNFFDNNGSNIHNNATNITDENDSKIDDNNGNHIVDEIGSNFVDENGNNFVECNNNGNTIFEINGNNIFETKGNNIVNNIVNNNIVNNNIVNNIVNNNNNIGNDIFDNLIIDDYATNIVRSNGNNSVDEDSSNIDSENDNNSVDNSKVETFQLANCSYRVFKDVVEIMLKNLHENRELLTTMSIKHVDNEVLQVKLLGVDLFCSRKPERNIDENGINQPTDDRLFSFYYECEGRAHAATQYEEQFEPSCNYLSGLF